MSEAWKQGLWFAFLTSFILKMLLTTAPRRWSKLTRLHSRLLFLEATWIKNFKKAYISYNQLLLWTRDYILYFQKSPCFAFLIHPLLDFSIPFNCSLNFPDTHLRFVSTSHLHSHYLFWIFTLYLCIFYILSTSDNKAFNKNRSL